MGCKLVNFTFDTDKETNDLMIDLTKKDGLYPSKSELVRVAVKHKILKVIKERAGSLKGAEIKNTLEEIVDKNIVKIPYIVKDENGNLVKKYKYHKVIREA